MEPLRPAYAVVRFTPSQRRLSFCRLEERIASIVAGSGLIWSAHVVTSRPGALSHLAVWPAGPLELCAVGILIWMHAKWRRSLKQ